MPLPVALRSKLFLTSRRFGITRVSLRCFCTPPAYSQRVKTVAQSSSRPDIAQSTSPYVSSHFRLQGDEVSAYLSERAIHHRRTSTHAIVEICPFCHDTKFIPDNHYKLYISRDSGTYYCHRCGAKGSWFSFRNRLSHGDQAIKSFESVSDFLPHTSPESASPILSNNAIPPQSVLENQHKWSENLWKKPFRPVLDYLGQERGLNQNTLRHFGVGAHEMSVQVGGTWRTDLCMTFPMYNSSGALVRHKIRSVRTKSGMRLTPKGGAWGLFGLASVPSDVHQVVLTEGELDAMSVWQTTGQAAISLPNGASSLPLELLPMLERFHRITLWMDSDAAGDAGAKQFARKLGLSRVNVVVPSGGPDGCKDANDWLRQGGDLKTVIHRAAPLPHDGVVRFDDLRESVFDHLKNKGLRHGVQSQSLPRLNKFLKGHRPGELTILSGHTGIGKTTLLTQLSLDYCLQGIPTMWGSFEIGNVKLAADMLTQLAGALGERGDLLKNYDMWSDRLSELPLLFMKYQGSCSMDMIMDTMEYSNYVHDCSHYVLDNLQFMTYGQGTGGSRGGRIDRFEVMDNALSKLRGFCSKANAHVSLVVHPRKENDNELIQLASVFGSAKATQEADNVIVLQRAKDGIAQLDVKKNRYDGTVGSVKLSFDRKWKLFRESDRAECTMKMTPGIVRMQEVGKSKISAMGALSSEESCTSGDTIGLLNEQKTNNASKSSRRG